MDMTDPAAWRHIAQQLHVWHSDARAAGIASETTIRLWAAAREAEIQAGRSALAAEMAAVRRP